mmetsp:Transcript_10482/g.29474  ORF Transcript_10482/g.29474 Transcript_10482/m.29474 type:complete len:211 (-) Transcript_10482:137-769(-)
MRCHKSNCILLGNAGLRLALALPLHPRRSLLQRRLGQKVHYRARNRALEFDVTSIEYPSAAGLGGVVLQMPMPGHIVKVRQFVVIKRPSYRVMRGRVDVIAVVLIRVSRNYADDHLGLDRRGAISILLDDIIFTLLELVHLANVVVDVQNLIPDRVLWCVDVLDANRPAALVALPALPWDLFHHGLVLGKRFLILWAQLEHIERTGAVGC